MRTMFLFVSAGMALAGGAMASNDRTLTPMTAETAGATPEKKTDAETPVLGRLLDALIPDELPQTVSAAGSEGKEEAVMIPADDAKI